MLSATRIIWLKRFRCALRTTFWPFIWYDFALIVENVFSLCFIVLSWNFTDGGSSSNLVRLNDWYASSPTSNALRRSLTTAGGATVPLDRLTGSDSSGDNLQINQRLCVCFIFPYPWTLQIRMRQFGNAFAYHVPQRSHVHGPILGGQFVSAHGTWLQTEPLGLPGVCVSLFIVSSNVWSTWILPKGL